MAAIYAEQKRLRRGMGYRTSTFLMHGVLYMLHFSGGVAQSVNSIRKAASLMLTLVKSRCCCLSEKHLKRIFQL